MEFSEEEVVMVLNLLNNTADAEAIIVKKVNNNLYKINYEGLVIEIESERIVKLDKYTEEQRKNFNNRKFYE